jgi:acyl carrier protein
MIDDARTLACSLAAEAFGLPLEAVPPDTAIGDIEAWDSLAHLRLIMSIESRLGRELTTDEAAEIVSLEDVARLLL